jgi:hypothetical protein
MGKVTWTDTWLRDEGGHFQLDTLSEGQIQGALTPDQEPL